MLKHNNSIGAQLGFDSLNNEIAIYSQNDEDYICKTDIAKYKDSSRTGVLIRNWIRNRNTIEFLGIWEQLNNLNFNPVEFDGFRKLAGLNSFTLTPANGLKKQTPSALFQSPDVMAGLTLIKICLRIRLLDPG